MRPRGVGYGQSDSSQFRMSATLILSGASKSLNLFTPPYHYVLVDDVLEVFGVADLVNPLITEIDQLRRSLNYIACERCTRVRPIPLVEVWVNADSSTQVIARSLPWLARNVWHSAVDVTHGNFESHQSCNHVAEFLSR